VETYAKICVNKSKPAMQCEGKCHLKKEMAKDDDKQNKSSKVETNIVLFIEHTNNISFLTTDQISHSEKPVQKAPAGFLAPVFHPPLV
jgi:hypothetical protein